MSLSRTGWLTIKPEIICKMEREEMVCMPHPPGVRWKHRTIVPGGYRGRGHMEGLGVPAALSPQP